MIIEHCEQGSDEWLAARCGVITMSHAKDLITGGKGITRKNYLIDVASERLSGVPVERVRTDDMMRGSEIEPFAKAAYEAHTGVRVDTVGLAYLDASKRISASPDGLCGNIGDGGVEIKCPRPRAHAKYIISGIKEHMAQIQGNMWIFNAAWWDFVSFCPEFEPCPIYVTRIYRDDEMAKKIRDSALSAVTEVDGYVSEIKRHIGLTNKDVFEIASDAKAAIEMLFGDVEVEL